MSDSKKFSLPWVSLPGVKRPNFVFAKIKLTIPTRVPSGLITFVIFMSILYIYAGGVYDLVEKPLAFSSGQNGPLLIFPSQDRQFLLEGIVAGMVMLMGTGGLWMMAQATTDPHDTSRASTYQTIGVILIILAFFILQSMFKCKVDPQSCQ